MKQLKAEYVICKIEVWNDLFQLSQDFMSHYVYRGQADSKWGLSTSLERLVNRLHKDYIDPILPFSYEQEGLKEFKLKYPLYANGNVIPSETDNIEWLSLMQHFGAPTRLLDFTFSPYIALFMAIDNFYADYCSLWCVNKYALNNYILNRYRLSHGNTKKLPYQEIEDYKYEYANKVVGSGCYTNNEQQGLIPISPHITNKRINAQQGLFVMPVNLKYSFEDSLYSICGHKEPAEISFDVIKQYSHTLQGKTSQSDFIIIKFDFPFNLKYQITTMLKQINITHETMFPGIEGLAKSMNVLRHKDTMYKS